MPRAARKSQPGARIYAVESAPGDPEIEVLRLGAPATPLPGLHAHAGLAIAYVDADGGSLAAEGRAWRLLAGDVVVAAPGQVYDATGLANASGWLVFFSPGATAGSRSGLGAWRTSPLLRPFVSGTDAASRRFVVPADGRAWWSAECEALARELLERQPGYREACAAHLTLLLVSIGRLGDDLPTALAMNDEPLLVDVFDCIERRFGERLSLRDVASAVHLTPGHLTTVVRRKTGRTVQAWIMDRRMSGARELLAVTDLSIDEVAERVGYSDTPYFVRAFKREHAVTPLAWRRVARSTAARLSP